jgi:hypothetical protein
MFEDNIGVNIEFERESHSFENTIDAGCFNPENWDIVMRSYIRKRPTP